MDDHRIVGIRPGFANREPSALRGVSARIFLVLAIAETLIVLGHLAWLLEVWLYIHLR